MFDHPPYSADLESSDLSLFLLKKILYAQRQRFLNDRKAEMSVTQWFQSQAATSTTQRYKNWFHGMTDVSIPEMNMLKNSPTLVVSVPKNLTTKLGFGIVNGQGNLICGRAT